MAKNTVKKIKELKTEKPSKITNEELHNMQKVISDLNRLHVQIGTLETRKHSLIHQTDSLKREISIIQNEFQRVYGTSDVNIEDGTINHSEDEQTN